MRKQKRIFKVILGICIILLSILLCTIFIFYKNYKVNEFMGSGEFNDVMVTNDDISITVLGYHSIADNEDTKNPIIISKDRFSKHMQAIRDLGFHTLSMEEFEDYINNNKPIPRKSVLITFDDGYIDNYNNAFPILKQNGMKATFFVIPKVLNKEPYMTTNQVKEMSEDGMDIESHTYSHERLSEKNYDGQMIEMKKSKELIKKITQKNVDAIAYPEGKYNDDTTEAAKDSDYFAGFIVDRGYSARGKDRYKINRVLVDYTYGPNNIKYVLLKSFLYK